MPLPAGSTVPTTRPKPLAGVRVLDLTRLLPGPVCTLHLADLGADVIKIEDPQAGDYARELDARPGEPSVFYRLVNRNKRSVVLDLKSAGDRATFLRLVGDTEVVVEGFRPGVADRLGIGYAAAAAVNPAIVYCSISGYGQVGPYRERAGHDINYLGFAGVLDQTGSPGGPPALSNLQIADLLGGAQTAAIGILAALLDARACGRGRHVDVAMSQAVLAHNIFALHALQSRGCSAARGRDLLTGGFPCYRVYRTRDDRYLAVGALEPKFWAAFCEAMQRPDWLPLQFAAGDDGSRVAVEIESAIGAETQAAWIGRFRDVDCCVTPVLTLEEALRDEQARALGAVVDDGGFLQYAPPLRMSELEFSVERTAPARGQHTAEVLADRVGTPPATAGRQ